MNVLVTGASGFIGKALCETLLKSGHKVKGVYRDISRADSGVEPILIPEINAQTNWSESLTNVDVIVHLAARVHIMNDTAVNPLEEFRKVNVDGTLNLARQAVIAGVKRFIFISSVKVNGESTELNKPFTENDIAKPQDAYGLSKYEAEQGLFSVCKESGIGVVVIRPPLVYGAGVKANFAKIFKVIKKGIPLPLGATENMRSIIYVENLTSFILTCLSHPKAKNQVFLVSDGIDVSTSELLKLCAKALGVKPYLFSVPKKLIEFVANFLGKNDLVLRLFGNLQLDITKANRLLDWQPPISVIDGLSKTAVSFKEGAAN